MDIYGAEIHIQKLLDYFQKLASEQPRMYDKSKTRLRELAKTCNEIVRVISTIIQDEALEVDESEFTDLIDKDVKASLQAIQTEIDNLHKFIDVSNTKQVTDIPQTVSNISSNMRKQALSAYSYTLKLLTESDIPYPAVSDCAKLIWEWFDTRFIKADRSSNKFRYNIRRLPLWIRDIVIVYSKALEDGYADECISEFHRWCDSIVNTDAKDKFAVPYKVYKFNKTTDVTQLTLTAAVIWDILLEYGLKSICTQDIGDLYPCEDSVFKLCGDNAPELLDDYANYKTDPSVLKKCNIVERGDA